MVRGSWQILARSRVAGAIVAREVVPAPVEAELADEVQATAGLVIGRGAARRGDAQIGGDGVPCLHPQPRALRQQPQPPPREPAVPLLHPGSVADAAGAPPRAAPTPD